MTSHVTESDLISLKHLIDSEYRGGRHGIVTLNKTQLVNKWPYFSKNISIYVLDVRNSFKMLATAEILITTGSSFSLSAASFAPHAKQLHIMFPPKEVRSMYNFRQDSAWMTYFQSMSTVPVSSRGNIVADYMPKFISIIQNFNNKTKVPDTIAGGCFEKFCTKRFQSITTSSIVAPLVPLL